MTEYDNEPRPHDTTANMSAVGSEVETDRAGLTSDERAAISALPASSALLVVQRGPNAGSRFLLDSDSTAVGRHPDSEIFLDDVTVSRRHCEFVRSGNEFHVRDVGSLNGTYVNRQRVDAAALHPGDEVQVGKFRLTFHPSSHASQDVTGEGS